MKNNIQGEQKETLVENLPNGWTLCRLGDVMRLKNGYAFKSKDYSSEGIPLVRISDINNGKVTLEKSEHIPDDKTNIDFIIQQGDLLIAMSGATTGKTGIYNGSQPCLQNQRVGNFKIISEDTVNKKYRNYYVASLRKEIEKAAYGGAQPNISAKGIEAFDFPLAPLNEQKRIVAEIEKQFSRLDEAVDNLKRVKANLKRYKASVLKAAVEGKLTEEWRKTNPDVEPADKLLERILAERRKKLEKAELAKMKKAGKEPKDDKWKRRYKETEPPKPEATFELPKTWTWCFGAQLFTWSSGKGLTKKKLKPGPYLVYGGNGINGYHFEYIVDRPTIVIGRVGANCGNVFISQEKSWITDNAIFADSIPSECFLDYFKLVYLYANLNKRAGGSGQPFVNQTILNEVAIRLPPLDEQKNIILEVECCLSVCEEIERIVDLNIIRSEHARQSILKKAFSGKLLKTIGGKDM